MNKQFRDRGLKVDDEVIAYLLWRMERSFESLSKLVEALDHESLSRQRPITKRLAGTVLDRLEEGS